jgi:5-methylcytosine-specific restriction endonuclease McrA
MHEGQPPFLQGGQYQLHHITPLENGGALYNVDNLMVVTDEFHTSVHSTVPLNP